MASMTHSMMTDMTTDAGRVVPTGLSSDDQAPAGLGPSGFDPSRVVEFDRLVCVAAMRVAEAKLFEGPVETGRSYDEYRANLATKQRVDDRRLDALISVVLYAKVHGDAIVALRDSDGSGEAGETAGLDPQGDSAGRQASPEQVGQASRQEQQKEGAR